MNQRRDGFILRPSYDYLLEALEDDQLGRLWRNIRQYQIECSAENIAFQSSAERLAFLSVKEQVDKDSEKYANKCRANAENGKQGGRPPKKSDDEF
jgi:hypothetical protein